MGYFQINTTIKAVGNINVVNPVALWRPIPNYTSNDVQYQFLFFATLSDIDSMDFFEPKNFDVLINDDSLDLTNSANWANMRATAETLLEAITEIGDNVTYVV